MSVPDDTEKRKLVELKILVKIEDIQNPFSSIKYGAKVLKKVEIPLLEVHPQVVLIEL